MPRLALPYCLHCGTKLNPGRHTGRGLQKFCSPSCGNKWRAENYPKRAVRQAKRASRVAAKNRRKRSKRVHPGTPSRVKLRVNGKRVLRYRYLMEKKLGRPLAPGEVVHHEDEDSQNDRYDNLKVLDRSTHSRNHMRKRRGGGSK